MALITSPIVSPVKSPFSGLLNEIENAMGKKPIKIPRKRATPNLKVIKKYSARQRIPTMAVNKRKKAEFPNQRVRKSKGAAMSAVITRFLCIRK
jgi:hypothetical protein